MLASFIFLFKRDLESGKRFEKGFFQINIDKLALLKKIIFKMQSEIYWI